MLEAVFALSTTGDFGNKDGSLPWPYDPADMQHFVVKTSGREAIVMGRMTFMAMPSKAISRMREQSTLYVITSAPSQGGDSICEYVHPNDLDKILGDHEDIVCIGGAGCLELLEPFITNYSITTYIKDYAADIKFAMPALKETTTWTHMSKEQTLVTTIEGLPA